MVSNKKTHIIFRSVFLFVSLVGCVLSLGFFEGGYNPTFYLYFTNISNYLCFGVILTLLIDDIKKFRKGVKNELSSMAPNFRLSVCVMIILTFAVYNTILNHPFKVAYWTNVRSILLHLVCPVMFVIDYLLFSKPRQLRLSAPFLTLIVPAIYVFYILIRAEVYAGTKTMAYPYFFLNVYEIGWGNVVLYILGIGVCVLALGFVLWAYDKLVKGENKKLSWDFSPLPKPEPVVAEEHQETQVSHEELSEKTEIPDNDKEQENTNENETQKVKTKEIQDETQLNQEKPKRGRPKKKIQE